MILEDTHWMDDMSWEVFVALVQLTLLRGAARRSPLPSKSDSSQISSTCSSPPLLLGCSDVAC